MIQSGENCEVSAMPLAAELAPVQHSLHLPLWEK